MKRAIQQTNCLPPQGSGFKTILVKTVSESSLLHCFLLAKYLWYMNSDKHQRGPKNTAKRTGPKNTANQPISNVRKRIFSPSCSPNSTIDPRKPRCTTRFKETRNQRSRSRNFLPSKVRPSNLSIKSARTASTNKKLEISVT